MTRHSTWTRLLLCLCGCFAFGAAGPLFAADTTTDSYNIAAADQHIIPAYRELADKTADLNKVATADCGNADKVAETRAAFADAFLAWEGTQHIRFGPVQYLSRDFRYALWPDKRGTVTKHLRHLLQQRDPALLEPESFANGSGAVQGFSALEQLLYTDPPANDPDAANWRCQVIAAITGNLERMSRGIVKDWTEGESAHRNFIATAASGNDYYDSALEVTSKLLNNGYTELELMVDAKLDRPLGESVDKAAAKRAEAWRSGLSLAAIRANLNAVESLYRVAFAPQITDLALSEQLDHHFANATSALDKLQLPLPEAVSDPAARERLLTVRSELSALKSLFSGELAQALGLTLGFNSLDGD